MSDIIEFKRKSTISSPRIIEFGTLSEGPDGNLIATGFRVDGGNQPGMGCGEVLVRALIARLQQELDEQLR